VATYKELPLAELEAGLAAESFFVLLDTARPDRDNSLSYLFLEPREVLQAVGYSEVLPVLAQAEAAASEGFWVAGALAYEAGYALEERLMEGAPEPKGPLLRLGVFEHPYVFNHRNGRWNTPLSGAPVEQGDWKIESVRMETPMKDFRDKVRQVKEYIRRGETYQVNYTTRYLFEFGGSPPALYRALRDSQKVPYAALMREGDWWALSLSPELFFRLSADGYLEARPMKGTAARGLNVEQDRRNARFLRDDPKNRAENLMIVDLMRNDLGRICRIGSVKVPARFEVERYDTLFQMTSSVTGRLEPGVGFTRLMQAIFPSGSVTGAPKLRSMQIINELEKSARGIYTGAMGFLAPDGSACFNVAIRTVELERSSGELGIGGAVVADSSPRGEYEECLLKAGFLTGLSKKNGKARKFELVETMLYDGQGVPLLELHLDRLRDSARYFSRPFSRRAARCAVESAVADLDSASGRKSQRVRLLLDNQGKLHVTCSAFSPWKGKPGVSLYRVNIDPSDRFFYHKTTNRPLYSRALEEAGSRGLFDFIFTNHLGQVTEGTISNVYAEFDGVLYTPPVRAGLLPGVYRRWLKRSGNIKVHDRILYPLDLRDADRLWVSNAVHGLMEAELL
jgi:para-aminobenzoate synthetase / 4-amino-4-deoxychorismate lyase